MELQFDDEVDSFHGQKCFLRWSCVENKRVEPQFDGMDDSSENDHARAGYGESKLTR